MAESRCLFCQSDTSTSVSVEHIVPESLGNTRMVLRRGIVCDRCNNYFAVKLEGPFLNSPPILALRHFEGLQNKRGRVPGLDIGLLGGGAGRFEVKRRDPDRPSFDLTLDVPSGRWDAILRQRTIAFVADDRDAVEPTRDLARFVVKAGVESIAERNDKFEVGLTSLIDDPALRPARRFARYGEGPKSWPVMVRRVYARDHLFADVFPDGQRVWESDFLFTENGDLIYAVSIFGLEFAVNLLEPDLGPYSTWLRLEHAPSPLYPEGVPPCLRKPAGD